MALSPHTQYNIAVFIYFLPVIILGAFFVSICIIGGKPWLLAILSPIPVVLLLERLSGRRQRLEDETVRRIHTRAQERHAHQQATARTRPTGPANVIILRNQRTEMELRAGGRSLPRPTHNTEKEDSTHDDD